MALDRLFDFLANQPARFLYRQTDRRIAAQAFLDCRRRDTGDEFLGLLAGRLVAAQENERQTQRPAVERELCNLSD